MSGSEWGCASTLEITGILGDLISVAANADSNLETAGCMKLVWKAPATARRTWQDNCQHHIQTFDYYDYAAE